MVVAASEQAANSSENRLAKPENLQKSNFYLVAVPKLTFVWFQAKMGSFNHDSPVETLVTFSFRFHRA